MIANHGQKAKHQHFIEGRNSRMDGMQAAVLNVKLPHLDAWTEQRIKNAAHYDSILNQEFVEPFLVRDGARHVYHLYVIQTTERDALMSHLEANGVGVAIHYPTPLPLLDCYAHMNFTAADFPIASHICQSIVSLPMYPELTKDQMNKVAEVVADFFTS